MLADGWQVIGVVSEADLLARRPEGLTAGALMTSPPITIGPDGVVDVVTTGTWASPYVTSPKD